MNAHYSIDTIVLCNNSIKDRYDLRKKSSIVLNVTDKRFPVPFLSTDTSVSINAVHSSDFVVFFYF